MDARQLIVDIAMSYLGKKYKWGGDDPIEGFDCSGLVIECLKSIGKLPREGDWTADSLYSAAIYRRCLLKDGPQAGDLVFWMVPTTTKSGHRAIHVEICISKYLAIGASGGGSKTKTETDAVNQNAYIKIRPIGSRPGKVEFADVFRNRNPLVGDLNDIELMDKYTEILSAVKRSRFSS